MTKSIWIAIIVGCGILGGYWRVWAVEISDETISMHGFISQGFLLSDANDVYAETEDGSFQFNEFGLTFLVQLSDRLHAGIQVLSRDLGGIGNNSVELDWAFADYRWNDWLGFRGGVLKIPWGIYNETRDIDMLRTSIFLPSSLYDEEERDEYDALQGIALYGSFPFWKFGTVNYQVQYGDKSLAIDDEVGGTVTMNSINVQDIYLSTIEWETPLEGLRLRQTTGEYIVSMRGTLTLPPELGGTTVALTETTRQTVAILSTEYALERFSLAAEGYQKWNVADGELVEDVADNGGWYLGVGYRLTDWMEIGSYYSEYYKDSDDTRGNQYQENGLPAYLAWQKDLALTTRFDFGEHCAVKIEGHIMDGAAKVFWNSAGVPRQETLLLAVKVTFNF